MNWQTKTIAAVIVLFVGIAGTFVFYSSSSETEEITKEIAEQTKPTEQKNEPSQSIAIKEQPQEEPKIAGAITPKQEENQDKENKDLVLVKRVIDGDTIELEDGNKVRYIGIDTPETVHPDKPIECFGREASDKNKELVEGKKVRLEKDVTDKDKYNRLLRYIYLEDGTFINLLLVKEGYATNYTYPPDVKYQDQIQRTEQEARETNRGLWSGCGNSPISTSGDCLIKGNISSSGEKIYHLPGQQYYDKTVIDESKGEHWFCSESEAQAAGWRKSKK